ncbi:WD40/YVTN/BNR-like repeat-containing protein [Aestuariivivens insulae]|uniref:WD40/YVTN/BNR-like repeat-containing protein n=1 Tax=Aestuariivivens insulae TaxID=1621988 RepID=UPI001F57FA39|nr:oxidoreductase [Aestuariivivens insulae]
MKFSLPFFVCFMLLCSCGSKDRFTPRDFSEVEIETILDDSLLSIRAIEILNDQSLAFAANNGAFGLYNPKSKLWQTAVKKQDSINLHFRSVAHTSEDFFMLSIENPALLFKTGDKGSMELVYEEFADGVFYDAMRFWNDKEGIAIGDSVAGCMSVIITRDGGETWAKIPCDDLPKGLENEGAFAASNTNIAIIGDHTWIATTAGQVYYSPDKGNTWEVFETPIVKEKATEGIYSIAFYDELNGFAIGGDYTKPNVNVANKIKTNDGGRTWQLVAENEAPSYRSCVQYMPDRAGKELVAVGFKGVDYSNDSGISWKHLSDEGFYTLRFLNDSVAYAAGAGRISKLMFREQ